MTMSKNPIGEKLIAQNSPIREREVDDFSDKVTHLIKTQDMEPIMKSIHAIGDLATPRKGTQAASKLIGTIPLVMGLKWAKESGTIIYSREFFAYARKRLDSNEFRGFRVRG